VAAEVVDSPRVATSILEVLVATRSLGGAAWAGVKASGTIDRMATQVLDVDPRTLHVPPSRLSGADPFKLQRQIAQFGSSTVSMPAP